MSEISSSFRNTIIGLMIISGAINTIGFFHLTQLISSKIGNLCSKVPSTNISFIPTCKRSPCSSESFFRSSSSSS